MPGVPTGVVYGVLGKSTSESETTPLYFRCVHGPSFVMTEGHVSPARASVVGDLRDQVAKNISPGPSVRT